MSAPAEAATRWGRSSQFELEATPDHADGSSSAWSATGTPCAVCRKPHGARLVRSLVVQPRPAAPSVGNGPIDPRYYPPAVPVLSRRSTNPINLSARWSLNFA
jgi:hypothetical protein